MAQDLCEFMDERIEELGITTRTAPSWIVPAYSWQGRVSSADLRDSGIFDWHYIIQRCCITASDVRIAYRRDDGWRLEVLPATPVEYARWEWPSGRIILLWIDSECHIHYARDCFEDIASSFGEDIALTEQPSVAAPAPPEPPTEPLPV
jgi:hypothetical protein